MTDKLSPEIAAQLDKLRDIHLPQPVSWWPLAPGWWMLLALICITILATLLWRIMRKRTARYLALRELERLDANDPGAFATGLSVLLRRVALRRDRSSGQLAGADWSAFLSARGMNEAIAAHLAHAPYARPSDAAAAPEDLRPENLRAAARLWIRRQT